MKRFMPILIALILLSLPQKVFAKDFVTNLSPAEFTARYDYFVNHVIDTLGNRATTDYSRFAIKDVFKQKVEDTYIYVAYIEEDYKNNLMNQIIMFGGKDAGTAGIYKIVILAEDNVPHKKDSLIFETMLSLWSMEITEYEFEGIKGVVEKIGTNYTFGSGAGGKNLIIYSQENIIDNKHQVGIIIEAN